MYELSLTDYMALLRRWKRLFAISASVLLVISLIFVARWSNYRSIAVVQIDQAEISANATTPMGASTHDVMEALADQRISAIQQKVLSTGSLIDIITKFDLYASARRHIPIATVATEMAKKIKVDLVSGSLANPASAGKQDLSAIAFKLSFDYNDPLLTQQVTDELATRFLDQDLKERRTQTEETAAFLDAQIAELEQSMSEQEKKIADYQKEHGVSRPESLAFNQQAAITATMDLQQLDAQIASNQGAIGALRAQLVTVDPYSRVIADGQVMTTPSVQLKALQSQYASLSAQYGPDHPDVVKTRHLIEALQPQVGHMNNDTTRLKTQIADVRANLEAAEKIYGPEHPDVVALKSQEQKLEDQLATSKHQTKSTNGEITSDADNPAYMQLVSELHAAEEQGKALAQQRKELKEQQERYQKAIIDNPEAEKTMAALTRDYDNAQLRYRELKEKKMSADMDEQMQKDRKGQRLTLIDPPELPLHTQPRRILLVLGAFLFSFLGGMGCVAIAQATMQSIIGTRQLEALVGVAPLVAIPHIYTEAEHEKSLQRKIQILWAVITKRIEQHRA